MAETSPLLAQSLALSRQERNEDAVQRQQRQRSSSHPPQPQAQLHPYGRSLGRKRSSSHSLRRCSTPPLLPVIHEDGDGDPGSLSASPSSLSLSSHARRSSRARVSSLSSSSSSSSSSSPSRYENFNCMSSQIVWPPEDDGSWPPGNNVNYGSIGRNLESGTEYVHSSPSSSSESSSRYERDYARYHSSRRYRNLRHVFTAFFVVTLSAAVWLPLLTDDSSARDREEDYSSNSSGGYFRSHHQFYDEVDENDDFYLGSAASHEYISSDINPDWYRHSSRRGSASDLDGNDDTNRSKENSAGSLDSSLSLSANISFADLAAVVLPPYFQETIELCLSTIVPAITTADANETLPEDSNVTQEEVRSTNQEGGSYTVLTTTSVMPSEVYVLRKTMLKTRDLLDVFSPVYPKHSSPDEYLQGGGETSKSDSEETSQGIDLNKNIETVKDMWKTLRHHLNRGYMLLGDFQDLDHAKIKYTTSQLSRFQEQIWAWHDDFMSFADEHGRYIRTYLSSPCRRKAHKSFPERDDRCRHVHSHSSHLFWGNVTREELPDGKSERATSALRRLGRSQLERAVGYLREALTYRHVISPATPGHNATRDDGHETYHNLRKELRNFVDEIDLFGYLLLPDSSLIPEIEKKKRVDVVDDRRAPVSRLERLTEEAVRSLKRARKLLGDLNDDYVAHSKYVEWDVYPEERSRLKKEVESRWSSFRSWAREAKLFEKIQFLRGRMDRAKSLRGVAAEEHSSENIYRSSNPTYSLETFLMDRKANPTNHVVIGNDAGDADTIVSAISLAYIESMHGSDQLTPIVSIPEDSFTHERPEVNLLLQFAGIDPANLLFIDDLKDMLGKDIKEGSPSRSMTLVDHNTLNPSLKHFRDNLIVTEIVDHHKDEDQFKETCAATHRNIAFDDGHALVASATTLVAERLGDYTPPYPSSVGLLLLGVILIDSVNLDESVGKVTQRDRDAARNLMSHTDWSTARPSSYLIHEDNGNITIDTNQLFEKLQESKYDPKFWSSLTVKKALGYDYKEFHFHAGRRKRTQFGISSVLVPGIDFLDREDFYSSTVAFMESERISFLAIMFAFYDRPGAALRRQLAFVSIDRAVCLRERTRALLASDTYESADLRLEEVALPAGLGSGFIFSSKEVSWRKNVVLFEQKNASPSRKQIGPMLEEYFNKLK